jgi:hypothetical protein
MIVQSVFILEYYFASKFFAAIREAFSNAYPDKELPNKTTIHRRETKFRVYACLGKVVDIFSISCKAGLNVLPIN